MMDMLAAVLKQSFVWYSQPLEAELARMVEGCRLVGEGGTGRLQSHTLSGFLSCQWAKLGDHLSGKVVRGPTAS